MRIARMVAQVDLGAQVGHRQQVALALQVVQHQVVDAGVLARPQFTQRVGTHAEAQARLLGPAQELEGGGRQAVSHGVDCRRSPAKASANTSVPRWYHIRRTRWRAPCQN